MAIKDKLVTLEDLGVAYSDVKADLINKADIIVSSASGAIASFSDGANYPVKQCVFTLNTVQSGSGNPSPTNIRPISGHTSVNAVRTGKNLLDNDNLSLINAFYSNATVVTASVNEIMLVIPCKANTTYTFTYNRVTISGTQNARICSFTGEPNVGSNGTMMASAIAANNSGTFTTGANDAYIGIHIGNIYTTNISETISASMLELGLTASTYEPYNGQSVTYQLGQTVYAGTLTVNEDGTGQIVSRKAYEIVTINSVSNPGSSWFAYTVTNSVDITIAPLSNYYVGKTYATNTDMSVFPNNIVNSKTIYFKDSRYSGDLSGFKAYYNAQTDGLAVCYELAEPIVTNLTEQEVLTLLKGTNNVWHDANGDIGVTYRADTKLYIDNKIATLLSV